jgi:hypothetical protein
MDPIVEKSESVRETQGCNEIVWNDQHPAVEQNTKIHAHGDDEKLRVEGVGSRVGRETGYGDFCFGRLLGADRIRRVWDPKNEQNPGQEEWSDEEYLAGSENARFNEIGSFKRQVARLVSYVRIK